jgi:FKBP-type peptidyl-prolyl cis-trans isomerase
VKRLSTLLFFLACGSLIYAKYRPPAFYDLVGASDLIVFGEIQEVKEKTFVLQVLEKLMGFNCPSSIEIEKFKDWTCSQRWTPYQKGQKVVAFLTYHPNYQKQDIASPYQLRSAGCEGEFPVDGESVYALGMAISGIEYTTNSPYPGQKCALAELQDALKTYESCFQFKILEKEKARTVEEFWQVAEESTLEIYRKKSLIHEFLVKSTLEVAGDQLKKGYPSGKTESGLTYKILRRGSGKFPLRSDQVRVHYEGKLTDGKIFDSSYRRGSPITFPLAGVIPGWTEGLQLMQEGAQWELVIPPQLAYGNREVGKGLIPPNSTLIFSIEFLEVIVIPPPEVAVLKGDHVEKTASGLQYRVVHAGKGQKPKPTDQVRVHYEGRLMDGTVFDSSYKRGEPIVFPLNKLVPGWIEALQMMEVGSKWELLLPPHLGYGARGVPGVIPPNAYLQFTVELLAVNP